MDQPSGGLRADIADAYATHASGRPLEASLLATLTYFVTLIVVRLVTTATRGSPQSGDVFIAGVHVHHMVFGIVALLVAGVLALDGVLQRGRAVLFGAGAALVLDEFALLVFLKDVYWLPQGSLSLFALAIGLAALLVNAWRGRLLLRDVGLAVGRWRARRT